MKQPTAAQIGYWEAKLAASGLSMSRGEARWLSYGFEVKVLDFDGRRLYRTREVEMQSNLDVEWPMSLV